VVTRVHRGPTRRPKGSDDRSLSRGLLRWWRVIFVVVLVGGLLGFGAVSTNAFGVGDKFEHLVRRIELAVDPPPDRAIIDTVVVTPRPSRVPPSLAPGASATPSPKRTPVDVNIVSDPGSHFVSEQRKDWCAPAGVQIVLSIMGKADTSDAFQAQLAGRVGDWESYRDSHNGEWGPSAMALALAAYGVPGYEVRAYDTRSDALLDAATALSETHSPVILVAWKGAHTWVMSGYKANADPTIFPDAKVSGTYILDPWYPRVSSIWGASDPPGTFQDAAEMVRNYLPWQRPEGLYPNRDGKFLAVVPTVAVAPGG
jgi:hypothetical protein